MRGRARGSPWPPRADLGTRASNSYFIPSDWSIIWRVPRQDVMSGGCPWSLDGQEWRQGPRGAAPDFSRRWGERGLAAGWVLPLHWALGKEGVRGDSACFPWTAVCLQGFSWLGRLVRGIGGGR